MKQDMSLRKSLPERKKRWKLPRYLLKGTPCDAELERDSVTRVKRSEVMHCITNKGGNTRLRPLMKSLFIYRRRI